MAPTDNGNPDAKQVVCGWLSGRYERSVPEISI
jgi:hypothetical protein